MNNRKSQLFFLLALILGTLVLSFFIFKPFIYAVVLALVFAVVFSPIYKRILAATGGLKGLSALLSTILILAIILIPLVFLGAQIFEESRQLYFSVTAQGEDGGTVSNISAYLGDFDKFLPASISSEFSLDLEQYMRRGLEWILGHLSSVFSNIAKVIVGFFIFLLSLYYLLKDGTKLKKAVIYLSPLRDINDEMIFKRLEVAINSVIKGSVIIAVIQGALTSVGFMIFGVPNAVLWGSLAAVTALIPGIGTSLVLIPAIIFLFINGATLSAVGLLVWGVLAVGLVDNFLGPKLIGRGVELHPFLILTFALGGITLWGPVGFLLGPFVLSLLFTLFDIYMSLAKERERPI